MILTVQHRVFGVESYVKKIRRKGVLGCSSHYLHFRGGLVPFDPRTDNNTCPVVWGRPPIADHEQINELEGILSMDVLNLDQAPQDINKEEFQVERVRLQAFVAASELGCKKELIRSGSLDNLRQCSTCYSFTHSSRFCSSDVRCINCGGSHSGQCTNSSNCTNYKGVHPANSPNCPTFIKEKKFSNSDVLST
ncbi:hypothetical protein TNCV_2416121 [Trichonephila clavipes]|nr:hypothetical protein TNCV_2416121 [Trichonephila clavipes]